MHFVLLRNLSKLLLIVLRRTGSLLTVSKNRTSLKFYVSLWMHFVLLRNLSYFYSNFVCYCECIFLLKYLSCFYSVALRMLAAIFLASQWQCLANKHTLLAGCSAFWPVNCIFLHTQTRTRFTAVWPFCYWSLFCGKGSSSILLLNMCFLSFASAKRFCVVIAHTIVYLWRRSYNIFMDLLKAHSQSKNIAKNLWRSVKPQNLNQIREHFPPGITVLCSFII
jgi:hypothetical protein